MRILLVEHEAHLRACLVIRLEAEGWHVVQAERLARATPPCDYDVAIVDAGSVTEAGRPLWEALAEEERVPVIALALTHEHVERLSAVRLPHLAYLVKPFGLRALVDLVAQQLHKRPAA